MKKSIILSIIVTLLLTPTIVLARGGHGGGHGGHGGHGSHHGGSHTSHTTKTGGVKGGAKSGANSSSKGSTSTKSGGSKSSSHTSTHSVLHGGGKSAFARNAMRAGSNATPVSSWKSLHTETKAFTDATNDIPPLYRENSATNILFYQSLFRPRHHYVPIEQKPEDLQKEEDKKNIHNILLMIGGTILVAVILVGILMLFF